jgi:2-desacetyl-2-hydroxyethyl bacteriochlorophyllide A dehydrogenase
MNMQSLNVLFTGIDRVEVYEEPIPELRANEVLVQTTKTLISTGTECICLSHAFDAGTHWDQWVRYPFRPGYSAVGRVIALGGNVRTLREGDRVAMRISHRQYAVLPEAEVLPIPNGVSDEDATWFNLATIVQNGIRRAEHRLGEAVVVVGLGLLGQLATQYLRLLGAREIIAIDPIQRRLEMARLHGATITLAMGALEARETVLGLTEGQGVDVVYDVTGAASVFPEALRLLRRFGRLILLGDTGSPRSQQLTPDVITKGLRIIGAHSNNPPLVSTDHAYWSHPRMAELFFTYLLRNVMRVSDLITHRYIPTDAPEAYRMLREERATAMGVIFDWTQL